DGQPDSQRKRWWHFVPLALTVFFILLPHPSVLHILIYYHLITLHAPYYFIVHLAVLYALTFAALCYLIVLAVRDPGPIPQPTPKDADAEVSLADALLDSPEEDDYLLPGRWCRICWAPKPERAHHCSACGRCVLKMDHHCPWIGAKCVGHRTYPAFLFFLLAITLYASYATALAIHGLVFVFQNPISLDNQTPLHMLFLAVMGVAFSLVVGSFFAYHVYLVLTNQTTIEHISPFLLLRLLPQLPAHSKLSSPPIEHELSSAQRRIVRSAHGAIRPYDLGWRRNVAGVLGGGWRRALGGCSAGDGRTFGRGPRCEEMLARLALEL
ncbi:DHHC palmitoyltransferase-domain-containing protein, partial [Vararia minispora EC-137]